MIANFSIEETSEEQNNNFVKFRPNKRKTLESRRKKTT